MEIDAKQFEQMVGNETTIKHKVLPNGMAGFYGPWLKNKEGQPRYFDTYTEALYANIDYKAEQDHKKSGYNKFGQTKEQEADLNERKKQAEQYKQKARVAGEMLVQAGAK